MVGENRGWVWDGMGCIYRECISATTLSSFSTAAIFSAEVGAGLPIPKKEDIVIFSWGLVVVVVVNWLVVGRFGDA